MSNFATGPFYSHTSGYAPKDMAEAIDHIESVIEDLGPFDGILGFSQGAALVVSYLHRCATFNESPAFKFALCFSSVLPCSSDEQFGDNVLDRICPLTGPGTPVDEPESDEKDLFRGLLQLTIVPAQKNNAMLPSYDINIYADSDVSTDAPRLMHAGLSKTKIRTPTIHVIGKKDAYFMRNMSEAAYGLFDEKYVKRLEHGGGHQPPQKPAEIQSTIRAMEWAISRAM